MKTTIKKWGNSAAVRIPASVLDAAHLTVGEKIDVRPERGRIVIEPVHCKDYKLGDLVRRINAANRPKPVAFGPPVGREIL